MLSALCKNTERVIPLFSHAAICNGPGSGNTWYPATFLVTSSWLTDQICPPSLVLSIFESINFIFTALPFSFSSCC